MKTFAKIAAWTAAVLVALVVALLLYLRNADLSLYQGQIQTLLSDAIGQQVEFGGRFELHFGRTSEVTAENVTLTNPRLGTDADLLRVGRFAVSANTWSLVRGPIVIEDLRIDSVDLKIVRSPDGSSNWDTPFKEPAEESPGDFEPNRLVVKNAKLADFALTVSDPSLSAPLSVAVEGLTIIPDDRGMLHLDLAGMVNAFPLAAKGDVGTLDELLRGRAVAATFALDLGRLHLALDGQVDNLRRLQGARVELSLAGPQIENVTGTLGLPTIAVGDFELTARVGQSAEGNAVHLDGHVGTIELFADGTVDEFLDPQTVAIQYRFSSPESAYIAALFKVDDPARAAFDAKGTFRKERRRLEFRETDIVLGRGRITADGWIEGTDGIPDLDLQVSASGPDLSVFEPLLQINGIPANPFDVNGRVQKQGATWDVEDVVATVGDIRIEASGALSADRGQSQRIEMHASGPDVSVLRELSGIAGLPVRPFDVAIVLTPADKGIAIDQAKAAFGDNRVELTGVFNPDDRYVGTDLQVSASGPGLSEISALQDVQHLPAGAFDIRSHLLIDRQRFILSDVRASAGDLKLSASGHIVRDTTPMELAVDFSLAGDDIARGVPIEPFTGLDGKAYRLDGDIGLKGFGLTLKDLRVAIGNLEAGAKGTVDLAHGFDGPANLSLSANAPDTAILQQLAGLGFVPPGALSATANVRLTEKLMQLDDVRLDLGDYHVAAAGDFGRSRPFVGNNIRFDAQGPELQVIGRMAGYDGLAPKPFRIAMSLSGTETGFRSQELAITVGDSDISGSLSADLSGAKPDVRAELTAGVLDLRHAQQQLAAEPDVTETAAPESGADRLFPEDPLPADALSMANVDLQLGADEIRLLSGILQNFKVSMSLLEGRLHVDPVSFSQSQGDFAFSLDLAPQGGTFSLESTASLNNVRPPFLAAAGQDPATIPPIHAEFSLRGRGNSVAGIMADSDGYLFVFQDKGEIAVLGLKLIFNDLITSIVQTINPLAKRRDYVPVECGTLDVNIADGMATIRNMVFQTDALLVVGSGNVNLANENLDLSIRTKPREGLGVSVGGVINSLLRVGGTLTSPAIEIDPKSSVTTTGVAVATGGLSLLARGLFDRLSAEADTCETLPRTRPER